MKIYGDLISPFVRMTVVTAHEVGLGDKVLHIVEAVKPTEVNQKLAALSPIGKIPILETDHGHGIHDSRVIIEYLCHVAGNSTLIPNDGVKRFKVLTLQALGPMPLSPTAMKSASGPRACNGRSGWSAR